MIIDDINVDDVLDIIKKEAERRRESAAFSGAMSDNGARDLEDQIKFFVHGIRREYPLDWNVYVNQLKRERDPEYAKFLELAKKFGHKL